MLQVPPGWWGSFHSVQADKQLHIYLAQTRARASLCVCMCMCVRAHVWLRKMANDALKGHMSGSASLQFVNGWKDVCTFFIAYYTTLAAQFSRYPSLGCFPTTRLVTPVSTPTRGWLLCKRMPGRVPIKIKPRTHLRAELISSRQIVSSDLYSSTSKHFKDIPVMSLLVFFPPRGGKPSNLCTDENVDKMFQISGQLVVIIIFSPD